MAPLRRQISVLLYVHCLPEHNNAAVIGWRLMKIEQSFETIDIDKSM